MRSALHYLLHAALCIINTHLLVLADPATRSNNKEEAYKYQKIYSKIKAILEELGEE